MATDGYGKHVDPPEPPISEITFPGSDIYTAWALGPGRNDFFPETAFSDWIPVLLELKNISALAFAEGKNMKDETLLEVEGDPIALWRRSVVVPRLFLRANEGAQAVLHITALVRVIFLKEFLENQNIGRRLQEVVSAVTMGTPPAGRSVDRALLSDNALLEEDLDPLVWPDLSGNPPSRDEVIVGIIDDGIPFAHERFWWADRRTRIQHIWLQDPAFNDNFGLIGREFDANAIDLALAGSTFGGAVDEDEFYRLTGAVDFLNDDPKSVAKRLSHGAHVMDLACGYDYRDPVQLPLAEKCPIVAVQLPTESTADTSGLKLEPFLYAAMRYIWHCAHMIAFRRGTGPIPIVINFSYGHHLGAHDGSFHSERAIENLIAQRLATDGVPLRVVVPSGNSHLTRTHAEVLFDDGDEQELSWRVQPNDKTWSFLEIWMPIGVPADRMAVSITPPGGDGTPPSGATPPLGEMVNRFRQLPPFDSTDPNIPHECKITYRHDSLNNRGMFLIEIAPTERLGPHDEVVARSGVWEITLERNAAFPSGEVVNAWIWRDGPPLGFPIFGRQSYFDHDCYQRYDDYGRPVEIDDPACEIRREGTISGLATTDGEMIVVGGYLRKEDRPSPYSAGGPTNGPRVGPDAMAVSDDSVVHRGRLAAGTRSGSTTALDGTSVAAPQITRWIAENVVGTNLPGRSEVEANADPFAGQRLPDPRRGYGRIEMSPIVPHERLED